LQFKIQGNIHIYVSFHLATLALQHARTHAHLQLLPRKFRYLLLGALSLAPTHVRRCKSVCVCFCWPAFVWVSCVGLCKNPFCLTLFSVALLSRLFIVGGLSPLQPFFSCCSKPFWPFCFDVLICQRAGNAQIRLPGRPGHPNSAHFSGEMRIRNMRVLGQAGCGYATRGCACGWGRGRRVEISDMDMEKGSQSIGAEVRCGRYGDMMEWITIMC